MKQKLLDKVRRIGPGKALLAAMVLGILAALLSFINYYSLQNVTVLGNVHYTEEEIRAEVTKGIFGKNTWAVSHLKSSFMPDDMELIDQIDVTMKDHHTLQITVQERQLIGYVQYLDCNLYFDSEGRVMDSVIREEENGTDTADGESEALTAEAVGKTATSFVAAMKEAPLITGLSFTHAQLHEILPVSDDSVFYTILGIARMINKYDINPDAVNFDENMQITLTYGNLTVNLGKDELIEEKLTRMAAILPSIEGKSGILHMEDYTSSTQNIVFSQSTLAAEGIDEDEDTTTGDAAGDMSAAEDTEGDSTADTTSKTTTAGQPTGTVDHSYALVAAKKQQSTSQNTDTMPQDGTSTTTKTTGQSTVDTTQQTDTAGTTSGTVSQGSSSTTTGTASQGSSSTTTGTASQGSSSTTTGTAKQGTAGTTTGQTPAGSTGTSGSGDIQIDKPVLGNLQ
ncbi:MAG: hypothetical protein V8S26_01115 [Lachnospiraceae bacterium]